MDKWEYLQVTLVFSRTDRLHALEAVVVEGQRHPPPEQVWTRTQILDYYGKLGWIAVKSYSDVYTFKRTRAAKGCESGGLMEKPANESGRGGTNETGVGDR